MGAQAAEQIIAGVVLSERLAVTMYGAIHRAQFNGQRNLRGLVVDPKILSEDTFRLTLTDARVIESVTRLDHPNIVATATVESGGSAVVVVTRGAGRYVTVQDLIASSKGTRQGGKLSIPVAGLIGKAVIEALATAHRAGVIHGAVHPRSVLIDEDGAVRLGDFVVGRALTTAVAHGADSSLWRGLTGYIAPELVVGEDPTPGVDVYAVGAMLFTMFSGEAPPGQLRVTPAVERLVQRALDTDPHRRYKTATDLLENLLEAMEDDRWELAERTELVREAGLSRPDSNIDDATEDLLASLGTSAVSVTPTRPSMDLRAEAAAAKQLTPSGAMRKTGRLDALLADLGSEQTSVTSVEAEPFRRDPISELINLDPRRREAIISTARVPSLDDPDEETPLPRPASRDSAADFADSGIRSRSPVFAQRPPSSDERAALDAIGDLDVSTRRVSTAADQAAAAADKLEQVVERAERAAQRVETGQIAKPLPEPAVRRAPALPDPHEEPNFEAPRLKSRLPGIIALIVIAACGYFIYHQYNKQDENDAEAKLRREEDKKKHDEAEAKAINELPDPGTIKVTSNPSQAGVWLKIGRTPVDSLPLSSAMMHELRIEGVDGYEAVDTQVVASHWSGEKTKRKAAITIVLKPNGPPVKDPKTGKPISTKLPSMPPKPPEATGFTPGRGSIHVESTPPGAEVWMFLGMTNQMELNGIQAGLAYELRLLEDGYLPGYVSITADEWRDGGDLNTPINAARKKAVIEKNLDLVPDPNAKPDPKKGK